MTQPTLARCVGCAVITIQKIEADERRPARQMAEQLADCLVIPASLRAAFLQSVRGERAPDRLPAPANVDLAPRPAAILHNLPAPVDELIGRTSAMTAILHLLQQPTHRLITLVGVGGVGKTSLALAVAHQMVELATEPYERPSFLDGIWLADLAPLRDPALVPQAIAQLFGLPEQTTQSYSDTLVTYLQHRRLLLLLDNCEHLLMACALLVERLLRLCPRLTILATSREPLNIAGEIEWRVPPLTLPPFTIEEQSSSPAAVISAFPAVQLFVRRGGQVQPGFTLTDQNARAVAQLCQRLDGLPLALALAAARLKSLTVEQILLHLRDRVDLLTSGRRTDAPRQQSLRAALDWSYALLEDEERQLFQHLAAFAGGFTLAAVEAIVNPEADRRRAQSGTNDSVCRAPHVTLDMLTRLVDKSLVVFAGQEAQPRYYLLETVQQYASEQLVRLAETDAIRQRHFDYFLSLAQGSDAGIRGREQLIWLQRLDAEYANLRAALSWALTNQHQPDLALQLAVALGTYWTRRSYYSEGRQWLALALAHASPQYNVLPAAETAHLPHPSLWALAILHVGRIAFRQGDYASASVYLTACATWARQQEDKLLFARALSLLGFVKEFQGDHASAYADEMECLTLLAGQPNTTWLLAHTRLALGFIQKSLGQSEVQEHFAASLALFRQLGDAAFMSVALLQLGGIAFETGDLAAAQRMIEEAASIRHQLGDPFQDAHIVTELGNLARHQGDWGKARSHFAEGLQMFEAIGNAEGMAMMRHNLAYVALGEQDLQQAEALFGESLQFYHERGDQPGLNRCQAGLIAVACADDDYERALRLLAAVTMLQPMMMGATANTAYGVVGARVDQVEFARTLATLRANVAPDRVAAIWP